MPMEFTNIAGTSGATASLARAASKAAAPGAGSAFAESLGKLVDGVEKTEADANGAVVNMLDGTGEVHDAMIALQRAEMTLQFTLALRNKLVQAYQDIMKMPV
jgi:flagellar hook-basal body complex protein FliE